MRGHGGELTGPEPGLFLQSTGHGWRGQRGPAAPPGAPLALPGGRGRPPGLSSRLSPPGRPFFSQAVLILQEAEQGANLSLIFEARPLI